MGLTPRPPAPGQTQPSSPSTPKLSRGWSQQSSVVDRCARPVDLIASNVDAFVPEFDSDALHALAQYADRHGIRLSPGAVVRVAPAQPIQADVVLRLLASAEPAATTPQIVEVFTALGGNYAKVSRPGARFNLRDDGVHEKLLAPLKVDNVIKTRRNLTNRDTRVTVL